MGTWSPKIRTALLLEELTLRLSSEKRFTRQREQHVKTQRGEEMAWLRTERTLCGQSVSVPVRRSAVGGWPDMQWSPPEHPSGLAGNRALQLPTPWYAGSGASSILLVTFESWFPCQ